VAHRAVVRATGVDGPGGTLGGDDERGTRTDASEYRRSGGFNFDRVSLLRGRSRVDKELTSIRIFDAHRNSDFTSVGIFYGSQKLKQLPLAGVGPNTGP
jgi:hypothetical protein